MGDDAMTTLALSGADNTGKTKQLGILTRRIGPAAASSGPLDAHDVRWEAIKKNDMSRWWFETGPMQEVAEVLAASYLQRSHHSGARTAWVRLMDRGMPMLEASVAATAAVRENLTPEQAADKARDLLEPYARDMKAAEARERGIVLLHHEDPAIGTARALSHETSTTPTYADYQRHFQVGAENTLPAHHRARPEDQIARQCVPRRGQPDDVAAAIAFLAAPSASFITGQSLHIDGGWLLH
ncbi:SDR family oxidoreductase [Streptomyces platensis]|uniref:SDR family oxidoreductase n=1 Tax=Streptomyces platensis TaxID=58346 RepID=UPI0036CC3CA3